MKNNISKILKLLLENYTKNGLRMNPEIAIALKELKLNLSSDIENRTLFTVLKKMKEQNKTSHEDFDCFFKSEKKKEYQSKQLDKWNYLIPFDIEKIYSARIAFEVLKSKYTVISIETAQKLFGKRNISSRSIQNKISPIKQIDLPRYFLKVHGQGKTFFETWSLVDKSYEILGGVFEFFYNRFTWTYTSNWFKPRLKTLNPNWLIGFNSNREMTAAHFITEEDTSKKRIQYTPDMHKIIKKTTDIFKQSTNEKSIQNIIGNTFFLYRQAMITKYNYDCFLKLWQILEAVFLSDRFGGQTDKIIDMVTWLIDNGKHFRFSIIKTLNSLKDKRNDIVHKGIIDVDDNDINLLKYICEIIIQWLLSIYRKVPTINHLDNYYRFRSIKDNELKIKMETIKLLFNERNDIK